DEPSVAVVPDSGGDPAYCAQRYKSYDPASGTYLGYDGQRHPCP
ncbi:BA14K family protein, partial [Bradyrhizobium genomosp. III]